MCVCVCMYVCIYVYVCMCGHARHGRIFQPIFKKFGKDIWGLNRKNWLGWGRNPKMPSPILTPKTPKFTAEIGNSQPNIKCKLTWEWTLKPKIKDVEPNKYVLEADKSPDGHVTYF